VPIYFVSSDPNGQWTAGEEFGVLLLTRHGAGYTNSAQDEAAFNAQYNILLASLPEPSTLVMSLIAAATLAGYGWRRRRPRTA
jgi:hypothetical protein